MPASAATAANEPSPPPCASSPEPPPSPDTRSPAGNAANASPKTGYPTYPKLSASPWSSSNTPPPEPEAPHPAHTGAPIDLTPFFPEGGPFPTLIHHAWHGRTAAKAAGNPVLVLVGGYAGSGKTEFARFLSDLTGWTILDKDALTRRMTERLLVSLGGNPHDRHTGLYLDEVRPLEYKTLLSAARGNIDSGVSLILAAPFVEKLNDRPWLSRLTHQCNAQGVDVTTIWVHADPDTMHDYMEQRDAPRDAWKLTNWDEYISTLDTEDSPQTTQITIDNRHGAAVSLAEQTRRALQKITA